MFWREAVALRGAATLRVLPSVLVFGAIAACVILANRLLLRTVGIELAIEVAPHEVAVALLGLLLVLRTNTGYDRWWEARKLWGGIVNQSRTLAVDAIAYGPDDPDWRDQIVRWTAAFSHACRASLRNERGVPELVRLLGEPAAIDVMAADHMPLYISRRIAAVLREGCDRGGMDRFAFLQADRERATLIDHLGGCERILRTPLARVYSINVRRFILLYVMTLPFALLHKFGNEWLTPLAQMLITYPILALDQIGVELQNPFSRKSLSHLPLDDISATIERNLLALLAERSGAAETLTEVVRR